MRPNRVLHDLKSLFRPRFVRGAIRTLRLFGRSKPRIKTIFIFGSVAKNNAGPRSDLDIAIELYPRRNDRNLDAAIAFDRRDWEEELAPKIDRALDIKLLDGARTPVTTAGVKEASILAYDTDVDGIPALRRPMTWFIIGMLAVTVPIVAWDWLQYTPYRAVPIYCLFLVAPGYFATSFLPFHIGPLFHVAGALFNGGIYMFLAYLTPRMPSRFLQVFGVLAAFLPLWLFFAYFEFAF